MMPLFALSVPAFVVPTSGRENRDDVWAMKGSEGLAQGEMEERP